MARLKHTKRSRVLSEAEILRELSANVYALLALQTANAKTTEEKFTQMDRESRKNVKAKVKREFAGLRPDQIARRRKQKGARGETR